MTDKAKVRPQVVITFDNENHKQLFFNWLCGQGEQGFMRVEEDNDLGFSGFNYHVGGGWLSANQVDITRHVEYSEAK